LSKVLQFQKLNMNNILPKYEKGNVLLIVAIFLPVILGLLALVLNVGTMYYAKSAYTSIADTATASGLSILGDEIVKIIEEKLDDNPSFEVKDDIWDNLDDDDREKLTEDSGIVNDIEDTVEEYLQKNIAHGAVMRNDFVIENIKIDYPYEYNSSDSSVKVHLEFVVKAPIHFIESMNDKDILVKAESQLRIK